jgi:hypothetical protein
MAEKAVGWATSMNREEWGELLKEAKSNQELYSP